MTPNDRSIASKLGQLLNRTVVRALAPRLRFSGRNHLPYRGPFIVASNHLSHADSALITSAVHQKLSFMAMSELFEIPLWGKLASWCGAFPVQRGKADRKALAHAAELLRSGRVLIIYPEGFLAPDGKLGTILPGAALLALRSGVPLIPVGISNSTALMPFGPTCPRPTWAPIEVHFGPPVQLSDLAELPGKDARETAADRMEIALRECVKRADAAVARRSYPGAKSAELSMLPALQTAAAPEASS